MVLPPPTAPKGEAPAEWLSELRRWLHLGRKGVIVMIRDAQPTRLRDLVEMLEGIEPGFRFTTRAADITECDPGELVLLAPREEDLDWLNLNRPQFAQRELRAVVWTEAPLSETFRFRAPDLHDWVSHFVRCPPGVPRFAIEGLRVGLRWWPGVAWRGPRLDLALEQLGIEGPTALDPGEDFETLVTALSTSQDHLVRWTGVNTSRKLWRIRWALACARHHGPNILDAPSTSVLGLGWFAIDPRQLELHEAFSRLRAAGIADPGKMAARLECEPGAIADLHRLTDYSDEDTLDRVVLFTARPDIQRAFQEHPAVHRARHDLVHEIKHTRYGHPRHWDISEIAVFASIERDSPAWPKWPTHLIRWELEHALRMGVNEGSRLNVVELFRAMDEPDIAAHLEKSWEPIPTPRFFELWDEEWRDPWEDTHESEPQVASPTSASANDVDPVQFEHRLALLMTKGNAIGWDATVTLRTFAKLLERLVVESDRSALADATQRVLVAASDQLGAMDPGQGALSRVAGIALGAAGDQDRALLALQHAWEVLHDSRSVRDELAAELASSLAVSGRFSDAARLFALVSELDDDAAKLRRFVLRAIGEPTGTVPNELQHFDIRVETQRYLKRRLAALANQPRP